LDTEPSRPNSQALRNRSGPISPSSNSFRPPRQQACQIGLAHGERQFPQILAIERENVEHVELNLVIMPARMQAVEIRDAVHAQQHRLAIDHKRTGEVAQRAEIPIASIVAVAGEQAHALALELDDQAIALMFDFMEPVLPRRNPGSTRRDARLEWGLLMRRR
jgi:hypothetical protein